MNLADLCSCSRPLLSSRLLEEQADVSIPWRKLGMGTSHWGVELVVGKAEAHLHQLASASLADIPGRTYCEDAFIAASE